MFVLDTHVVVWLAMDPARVSSAAMRVIEDARAKSESLFISEVSFYEIASMVARGHAEIDVPAASFLEGVECRFSVLPVTRHIALRSVQFPNIYPKDPVDRIIGATALVEGLPLITADRAIRKSNIVRTIW